MDTEHIVAAIREGNFSTRDLVLISCALASRGNNTTSVLGQYGEEIVAAAYGGTIGSFDQNGYAVLTAAGERVQSEDLHERKPGGTDQLVRVRRDYGRSGSHDDWRAFGKQYAAVDLYAAFRALWESKYRNSDDSFAAWGATAADRCGRAWHVASSVPYTDVTPFIAAAAERLPVRDSAKSTLVWALRESARRPTRTETPRSCALWNRRSARAA